MPYGLEMDLQANRATMISRAWKYHFQRSVENDHCSVMRVWKQVRSAYGLVNVDYMVAALTIDFDCSAKTARKMLARVVDVGLLKQRKGVKDRRMKVFDIPEEQHSKLCDLFRMVAVIDVVIALQREAGPAVTDVGRDLLPEDVFLDTRSEDAAEKMKRTLECRVQEIRDEKTGNNDKKKKE